MSDQLDKMSEDDRNILHYATGILIGLHHKYGVIDVVIYHDSIRIRIDLIPKEEVKDER